MKNTSRAEACHRRAHVRVSVFLLPLIRATARRGHDPALHYAVKPGTTGSNVIRSECNEAKDLRTIWLLCGIEGAKILRLHFIPLRMASLFAGSIGLTRQCKGGLKPSHTKSVFMPGTFVFIR